MELKEFVLYWNFDLDPESDSPPVEYIYSFGSYEEAQEFSEELEKTTSDYPDCFYECHIFELSTFLMIISDMISYTINEEKKKREEKH